MKINLGVCIGAQKAGTSWLYRCLKEHPEVSVPDTKELHFFSEKYHEQDSEEKYLEHFKNTEGVCVDISTSYLADDRTPERILKHFPQVRIIMIVREPVERAFSHYLHLKNKGRLSNVSILEAVDQYPDMVSNGLYGQALERYLRHFDPQQILVVDFSKISTDPQDVINRICDHLRIKRFTPSILNQKYHSSESKSNPLYRKIDRLYWKLRGFGLGKKLISVCRFIGIDHVTIDKLLAKTSRKKPTLPERDRAELDKLFSEDQTKLKNLLRQSGCPTASGQFLTGGNV